MPVSQHAAEVLRLRKLWHPEGARVQVFADPSTGATHGLLNAKWRPASVLTEYGEHGVHLSPGNNDRAAGYSRLLELLRVEPGRFPPAYARIPAGVGGSPRLFVFQSCRNLISQFQSAPVAVEGVGAGVMVDPKWEGAQGHAIACARYGAMSWQPPSGPRPVDDWIPDMRARVAREVLCRRDNPRPRVLGEDYFLC
jgi:hypothetical protein